MDFINLIEGDNQLNCQNMWNYFLENCSDAKGSSNNHQNWEGGYFDHINDIMKYAHMLYENLNRISKLDFKLSDAILVLFLHDIEKPIKYSKLKSIYPSDTESIRSKLISDFDITLDIEHINGLKYIHGENTDYTPERRVMSPLSAFCHCCDVISARIFFNLNHK